MWDHQYIYARNHHVNWTELQVWIAMPLYEYGEVGLFRTAPCVDGSRRCMRLRPSETGRNRPCLDWTKYKGATHPPEKEPPHPAVDGLGVTSGREFFGPRDQPAGEQ